MTPQAERHLADADRHIAEAEARITRQKRLIAAQAAANQDCTVSLKLLTTLEQSLALTHRHRRTILAELVGTVAPP